MLDSINCSLGMDHHGMDHRDMIFSDQMNITGRQHNALHQTYEKEVKAHAVQRT